MRQFSKTSTRPNYLFGQLPWYFKGNDTYVPNSVTGYTTDGLLERYLEIFCAEIDYEVTPYIDGLGLLPDAEAISGLPHSDPTKFLDHISEIFGKPPNLGTETQYITLIRHIISILQTKGSRQSVELFLNIYGYKIYSLGSDVDVSRKYDNGLKYDNGAKYDFGMAFYSNWTLTIEPIPGSGKTYPGVAWLELLREAIQKFLSPIFAILNPIQYMGSMDDTLRGGTLGLTSVSGRMRGKGSLLASISGVSSLYGSMGAISKVFLFNTVTPWVVGNIGTDQTIIVNYVAIRGTLRQVGEIRLLATNSSPYVFHEWDGDDLGFTVTGDVSGSDLRLVIDADDSDVNSIYMYYKLTKVNL